MGRIPEILAPGQVPGLILADLARWTAEESSVLADERSPFHGGFIDGDRRVLLVTGENAAGKSLAFRLIAQLAGSHGIEAMTLSIRERTGAGTDEMARMRRAFIYGEEETSSTGSISASVVASGFDNLTKRGGPAILALDEPELGLSDGYAEALGEYIGSRSMPLTGNACGVMVVTHSRRLAAGLVRGLGTEPAMLAMLPDGTTPTPTVAQWIASRETRSVDDLLALRETAHQRFRAVQRLLDGRE